MAEERKFLLPSHLQLPLSKSNVSTFGTHLLLSAHSFSGYQALKIDLFLVAPSEFDYVHGNSQAELTALSDSEHSS